MDSLVEIEERVRRLKPDQLAKFRSWFLEFDANNWDEQIASDLASGKLDRLIGEAIADQRAGKAREL